jgi:hypothetical protein
MTARVWAASFVIGVGLALMMPGPIESGRALMMLAIAVIVAGLLISEGTKEKPGR